ncbi:hypothetical protein [Chlorobium sp. N1]|uniref:hypothetical protein n=1 Tax=Chlorobium sp. N1 TaxID=2491138 RepID=UPI0013F1516A|nr:hypothetical protein [Chlorobium sp. N1]
MSAQQKHNQGILAMPEEAVMPTPDEAPPTNSRLRKKAANALNSTRRKIQRQAHCL